MSLTQCEPTCVEKETPESTGDGTGASTQDNSAVGKQMALRVATEHDDSQDHNPTERTEREGDVKGTANGSVVFSPL